MESFLDQPAGKLSGDNSRWSPSPARSSPNRTGPVRRAVRGARTEHQAGPDREHSRIREEFDAAVFAAESQINQVKRFVDRLYVIERGEIIAETDDAAAVTEDEELM